MPGFNVYFATDLHGSEQCFRKWLNAAAVYKVDALILGGDVTGKLIIPVVGNGGGAWHAEIHGERPVCLAPGPSPDRGRQPFQHAQKRGDHAALA